MSIRKLLVPDVTTFPMPVVSQYRHKKRCTVNCQDHREMNPLLKQKLKDRLQRTRQSARNKESRTLGFEAIGKLCRDTEELFIIPPNRTEKKMICNSQSKD